MNDTMVYPCSIIFLWIIYFCNLWVIVLKRSCSLLCSAGYAGSTGSEAVSGTAWLWWRHSGKPGSQPAELVLGWAFLYASPHPRSSSSSSYRFRSTPRSATGQPQVSHMPMLFSGNWTYGNQCLQKAALGFYSLSQRVLRVKAKLFLSVRPWVSFDNESNQIYKVCLLSLWNNRQTNYCGVFYNLSVPIILSYGISMLQ